MTERWDLGCIQKGKESASTGCWGCVSCCSVCALRTWLKACTGAGMLQPPAPAQLGWQDRDRDPCPPCSTGAASGHAEQQSAAPVPAHPTTHWHRFPSFPAWCCPPAPVGSRGELRELCLPAPLHLPLPPSALGGTNKGCSWSLNPREQLRDILLYPTTAQHSQHRPPAAPAPSSPHTTEGQHRTQVRATETLF